MSCSGGREKQEEKMEGARLLLENKGGKMRENEGELRSSGHEWSVRQKKNEEEWEIGESVVSHVRKK